MKLKALKFSVAFALCVMLGCASVTAYKSLGATEVSVAAAYSAFADGVIKGFIKTNDVPKVSHTFNAFQNAMHAAVVVAQFNTNAIATVDVLQLAQDVADAITQSKLVK